jgi:predicted RNA-binding protein with PIN domain
MHIIIDGYNVLKQVLSPDQVGLSQRRAFTNALGKYASKKNHTVTLVFDGGPDTWPTQEKDHGITVMYSGIKQSADDLIKKLLSAKKFGVLLVSSDNELKANAKRLGIASMNADDFYNLVKDELAQKSEVAVGHVLIKTSAESESWVDELMHADTRKIHKHDDQDEDVRKSPGQKLTKKERAYIQKIKKL